MNTETPTTRLFSMGKQKYIASQQFSKLAWKIYAIRPSFNKENRLECVATIIGTSRYAINSIFREVEKIKAAFKEYK